jgi:Flp pilus assembly protein TadD
VKGYVIERLLSLTLIKPRLAGGLFAAALLLSGCGSTSDTKQEDTLSAPPVDLALVEQALDEGDLAAAQVNLRHIRERNADDLQILGLMARLLAVTESDQALNEVVQQILTVDPENAFGLEQLGLLRLAEGRLMSASSYLTLAVAIDPKRWQAWNGLGIIADAETRYQDAHDSFERALALVPGHPKVMANLGWSRLLDADYEAAESLLRESLEMAPDSMTTRSNLAFAIALQGRYAEAMTLYERLYDRPTAANNVGYAALVRGDDQDARKYLELALELKPTYYRRAANNLAVVD